MVGVMGRTAIVTGAGNPNGIGFAIAAALAEAGANVVLAATTDRIHDRLREINVPERSRGFAGDLTNPVTAKALVDIAVGEFGCLDILVNNAGMQQTGMDAVWPTVDELDKASWDRTFSLSLSTCFLMTNAALPYLRKSGRGRIVNMSSVTGSIVTFPGGGAYGAAKAAMTGYTRSLALELGKDGIIANAVAPGWIDNGYAPDFQRDGGVNTPIGRMGTPSEVASMVLYLASDECSYLTGQNIVIDGGNTIQEYKGSLHF